MKYNDDAPAGRVLTRRELIGMFGGLGLSMLAAAGSFSVADAATKRASESRALDVIATPDETEGPFFVDVGLNRSDITAGTKSAAVLNGLPLLLDLHVYQLSGSSVRQLSGVHVDIWHADVEGHYSDEQSQPMQPEDTSNEKYLRGYQASNSDGRVQFRTIYPGWYMGRTVHIHFKVRSFSALGQTTREFTSQLFMDDRLSDTVMAKPPYSDRGERNVRNADDNVYTQPDEDGTMSGSHLLLNIRPNARGRGYIGTFNIGLSAD